ncbi:MAG: lipocalin-like domain-containing protein [Steroidobacteraceae bacterium]
MLTCAAAWASLAGLAAGGSAVAAVDAEFAAVDAAQTIETPRDLGSHPQFRTEWWYVTGWLSTDEGHPLGFQVTFFRTKSGSDAANPSAFAPRQLLIAHCAISDPQRGRLWQDQRVRRSGMGLAEAATADTHVWIDDWSLHHDPGGYRTRIAADGFSIDLELGETEPMMRNGEGGISRKGPSPTAASYHYSLPHLKVSGSVARGTISARVAGEAWLDHEWSSEYLDAQSSGWDWLGLNLDDGGALMAFRIRSMDGGTRWAGGTLRDGHGKTSILGPHDVRFEAQRRWISPRTGITYPVAWRVTAGSQVLELRPLLDDQENDTRLSTGAIYWEGAVQALQEERRIGRGYLELTGYGGKLALP